MENEQVTIMLSQHDQKISGLERRMGIVEETQKQINDLTVSTKELAMSVKNMTEEQKEQGERLKVLEAKPAKMWDSIIGALLTGVVGAILGAIVGLLIG